MTQDLVAGSERVATGVADKQPLLSVDGLNAWYGAAHILFDLSLTVQRGEVVALCHGVAVFAVRIRPHSDHAPASGGTFPGAIQSGDQGIAV